MNEEVTKKDSSVKKKLLMLIIIAIAVVAVALVALLVIGATGLSNGDEVTLTWNIDADYLKNNYGVRVKSSEQKFEVKDLKKLDTFDPFEDLEVTFTGVNCKGEANLKVKSKDEIYDNVIFTADKDEKLSEGDTVTVTFGSSLGDKIGEHCAENYGKAPSETTKEYKVEGLGEYVSSVSHLSDTTLNDMYEKAVKACEKELKKWEFAGTKLALESSEHVGTMVMNNKEGNGNKVNLFIKLDVKITPPEEGNEKTITVYRSANYKNVVVYGDNECTYNAKDIGLNYNELVEYTVGEKFSGGSFHKFSMPGFESLEEAAAYVTEKCQDEYDIDSNLTVAAE
ncbi:hypothetical protein SAMN02910298_01029 [Pseudobutyrivibrio sp. YE44]|uniref:hypothetical protein n=1 Tax=Pseudobutyrivibrio sp. YE44 TaxID=1520802 RepID=UPI00088588D6|nr:hypothetical protein [Pseudobutyrivibrio sp. YE44]SDB21522.1 hypothetical protein SAMN02910298_01029 [Pseudobutyrivibrio sp. YE44]